MHKLNEAIAYTDSVVMKQIFSAAREKLLKLPKPKDPMSRASFRRYASSIQSLINQTFSNHSYLLKNEISSIAAHDAEKYSDILVSQLNIEEDEDEDDYTYKGLKAFLPDEESLTESILAGTKGWTDRLYGYISDTFTSTDLDHPLYKKHVRDILEATKGIKALFNEYAYDNKESVLYRGLNMDDANYDEFMKKLKVGGTYSPGKRPSSWSDMHGTAVDFSKDPGRKRSIVLTINDAKGLGYDISGISAYKGESEILLRDGESFEIEAINKSNGITEITLKPKVNYGGATFTNPSSTIGNRLRYNNYNKPNLKFNDKSIDQMYKSLANGISTRARQKVSELYMDGKTSKDISVAIAEGFGLSTDEDGLSNKAIRARARAFFNTSLSLVRETQRGEAEKAYSQYISGWEFDAHMDNRTTTGCKDLEGHKFMKKGPHSTKEETIPPDAMVPRHFNCRSIHIAIPYKHNEEWKLISQKEIVKGDKKYLKSIWNKEIR